MDSFELNKIAGAVLGTLTFAVGVGVLSDILFETHAPETPGYEIVVVEAEGGGEAAPEEPPIANLLASADPAEGETAARACATCHSFDEGGANKVGPGLHGVVGRAIASHEGFSYSEALQQKSSEAWDYEHLNNFLRSPAQYAQGTIMRFSGIQRPEQRANVIAYLRSISPEAPPLPEPVAEGAAPAEGEAAPAEGQAAPAEGQAAPAEGQPAPEGQAAPAEGQPAQGEQPAPAEAGQQQSGATQGGDTPPAAGGQQGGQTPPVEGQPAPAQGGAPADQGNAAPAQPAPAQPAQEGGTPAPAPSQDGAAPQGQEAAPAPAPAAPPPAQGTPTENAPAQGGTSAPAAPAGAPAQGTPPAPQAPAGQPQPAAPAPGQRSEQAAPAEQQQAQAGAAQPAAAAGDPAAGEQATRVCAACHTFEEGGANKVGPALHGVFGRAVGSAEGYSYSPAFQEKAAAGGVWDEAALNAFLTAPRTEVPGTKMIFPGIKQDDRRADVIAYLRSLSPQ